MRQLARVGPNGDDSGLSVDDDRPAAVRADQTFEAHFQLRPEIGGGTRGDAGAGDFFDSVGVLAAVAGEHHARRLAKSLRLSVGTLGRTPGRRCARALTDLARGHARTG